MNRSVAFILSSVILFTAGIAFAQPQDEQDPQMPRRRQPMIERLQLNDQQKKQLETMRFEMQKQLVGVRAKRQTAMLELRQLLGADTPDRSAIERKMNEVSQIGMQAKLLRLNHWFEVNKILTPEQQKVWRELLKHPLREGIRGMVGMRFREGGDSMRHRPFMGGRPRMHERMLEMMEQRVPEEK
jgi:Spy/CpxP family protein refolding chaperone